MKYSIALASYNGDKYIKMQLDSFKRQTLVPDEIIICDDGSTDDTPQIIESYIKNNDSLNIRFIQNEKNLGYSANFFKAAKLATGDVIFFSDQDDIWNEEKIKKVADCFKKNQGIGAVLCNYTLIDEESHLINGKKGYLCFEKHYGMYYFDKMVNTFSCGGLNMAVRREFIHQYSQYIVDHKLSHDVPLGIILSSINKLYYLDEILVYHRVHSDNVTKPSYSLFDRLRDFNKQIKSTYNKYNWLKECKLVIYSNLSNKERIWYDKEIEFYKLSYIALKEKNLKKIFSLLFTNSPYINKQFAIYNLFVVLMMKFTNNG